MEKLKQKIIKWLATPEIITELYQNIAESKLLVSVKEINVKKGKLRYTLLIFKDHKLQTIFNIGRRGQNS